VPPAGQRCCERKSASVRKPHSWTALLITRGPSRARMRRIECLRERPSCNRTRPAVRARRGGASQRCSLW
jgi:hypothetical protein